MEDVFDQDQDNALPAGEKETCQTLLLTISLKEKMFNENQRNTAKKLLQKLEGDRRRKCRTSNIGTDALASGDIGIVEPSIRKELLIVSSKKRKSKGQKKSKADDESDSDDEKLRTKKKSRKSGADELDEDGFKKWSDDEGDWSDVDDGKLFWHHNNPCSCTEHLSPNTLVFSSLVDQRHLQEWKEVNQYETGQAKKGMGCRKRSHEACKYAMASVSS